MWALGTLAALVTIALLVALLVANLDAVKWGDLSRERIEQVVLFIGIAVALTTLFVLLAIGGASLGWTGFGDKTFWDWLQLLSALAIPVVLAASGFWFTVQQDQRQQLIEDQRAQQAQKIESQRANAERELAEQRAQDEALQAYLDQMGSLLLGEEKLRASEEGSEVRTLARARTLTVLERLDPSRKSAVAQFLVEAGLVQRVEERAPLIELRGANLRKVDLSNANLREANLREANLSGADLSGADLSGADLTDADLSDADLSAAELSNAYLSGADLTDANVSNAFLDFAYLDFADLSGAILVGANLSGADLSWVDLSWTNLDDVDGATKKMLEQAHYPAMSLHGATMPDGTTYPGRYAPKEFEPAVSFDLGEGSGWQLAAPAETPGILSFTARPDGELVQLFFTHPRHVFDPTNPSEAKELPAPENAEEWVSWFQRHPNLDTSKPVPASVGDATGKQIDITASSTLENYPQKVCDEQPCVPLYPLSKGNPLRSYEEWKDRFVILDVGGETVLIDFGASTDKFSEFLPKAQKVLDSVEWKGG